jgi:hypothetical protein
MKNNCQIFETFWISKNISLKIIIVYYKTILEICIYNFKYQVICFNYRYRSKIINKFYIIIFLNPALRLHPINIFQIIINKS